MKLSNLKLGQSILVKAAMYQFNGVALWDNGEYEGFSGEGLLEKDAESRAYNMALIKSKAINKKFKWLQKKDFKSLPEKVKKELQKDWKLKEI